MSEHDKVDRRPSSTDKTLPDQDIIPTISPNFGAFDSATFSGLAQPTTTTPSSTPQQVMALQRTVGNRATQRLLLEGSHKKASRQPDSDGTVQRAPTQVRNAIRDGRYGWTSRYEADFLDLEKYGGICTVDLKVKLVARRGVTPEDQERVQRETTSAVHSFFSSRFALVDMGTMRRYFINVNVFFVTTGQHTTVNLRAASGRDDATNWFVDSSATDRAHEVGHHLGLRDEYVDSTVPNRRNESAPGVHADHSVMGNYPVEGADQAQVQQRHVDTIAGHIGRATGKTLIATTRAAAEALYGDTTAQPTGASPATAGSSSAGTP